MKKIISMLLISAFTVLGLVGCAEVSSDKETVNAPTTEISVAETSGVGYIASAVFLSIALRQLPLGTAYAMWTGMGIVGTTLLGIFLFNEKLSVPQVICVILIVVGIAGLKLLAKD